MEKLTTLNETTANDRPRSRVFDMVELTKPRLTILSVLTTLAGFYLASRGEFEVTQLLSVLAATFMVGGGCGALNMVIESEYDAQMKRTSRRPIAAARTTRWEGTILGIGLLLVGHVWLGLSSNLLAVFFALLTSITYLFFYTPMKRISPLNTLIGAFPGALPPLIGWSAATGEIGWGGGALFILLFFWQMPHFLALAWMYRKDYERAGYRMLPSVDPHGDATSRQILLYSAALLPVSLIPPIVGLSGVVYLVGALLLSLAFTLTGFRFLRDRTSSAARTVFHFSLIYLPALLLLMVLDGPSF